MRRPCMSVKATTTVSISPLSTECARCSFVSTSRSFRFAAALGACDEPREEVARPGQVCSQLLGVALHRNDEAVVRLNGLDRPVLSSRRLMKARRELANRLVVQAVDSDLVLARGLPQLRGRVHLDGVGEVVAAETPHVVVLEVLDRKSTRL